VVRDSLRCSTSHEWWWVEMYQDRLRSVESLVERTVPFVLANEKRKRFAANGAFRKLPIRWKSYNLWICDVFHQGEYPRCIQNFLQYQFKCQVICWTNTSLSTNKLWTNP